MGRANESPMYPPARNDKWQFLEKITRYGTMLCLVNCFHAELLSAQVLDTSKICRDEMSLSKIMSLLAWKSQTITIKAYQPSDKVRRSISVGVG